MYLLTDSGVSDIAPATSWQPAELPVLATHTAPRPVVLTIRSRGRYVAETTDPATAAAYAAQGYLVTR